MSDHETQLREARERYAAEGIRFVQIEVAEIDGGMRGKLVSLDKGLGGLIGFSNILYGLTTADDVYESHYASYDNGFSDVYGRPDPTTARRLPWHPETVAVICDIVDQDGTLSPEAPRTMLRRAVEKAAALGFEARFAVEFEAYLYHVDDGAAARAGRLADLRPGSRVRNAYSLVRMPTERPVFETLMRRMAEIDAPVDATHTELGLGAVEFALSHAPALEAADRAMRAKTYFKEICAEHGMIASFMAKPDPAQPGAGGHVHQSLWQDGANAFWDGRDITDTARHYAAGQLALMPELMALFMPTINAYRRLGWEQWVSETSSWGHDNRNAALRLITKPKESAVRFEHRLPGADANPYHTIAAMLAAGLHGIEQRLVPPAMSEGTASFDETRPRLPASLEEALPHFKSSAFLRKTFGDRFVDHFAISREAELKLWRDWQRDNVSAWEHARYLETI